MPDRRRDSSRAAIDRLECTWPTGCTTGSNAGCGARPRRAGSRRAACPRRTSGLCGTRRGRWRGGSGSADRRRGSASKWTPTRASKRRVWRSRAQRTSSCQWASSQRSPRRDRSWPERVQEPGLQPLALLAERARGRGRRGGPRRSAGRAVAGSARRRPGRRARRQPQMSQPMVGPPASSLDHASGCPHSRIDAAAIRKVHGLADIRRNLSS